MGIHSKEDTFGENYALSGGSSGGAFLEKKIYAGVNGGGAAPGNLFLQVIASVAAAGGTSVKFELVEADNEDMDSNPRTIMTIERTAAELDPAKLPISVAMPNNSKKYLGVKVTTTGTFTAGVVDVALSPSQDFSWHDAAK